jgi:hypothetical protein
MAVGTTGVSEGLGHSLDMENSIDVIRRRLPFDTLL